MLKITANDIKMIHYWFDDHDYYGFLFNNFGFRIIGKFVFLWKNWQEECHIYLKDADLITCLSKAQIDYLVYLSLKLSWHTYLLGLILNHLDH